MNLDIKRIFILLGLLIIGYLGVRFVLPYFTPFILALVFSLIMEPLVKNAQRRFRLSRIVAISLVMFLGLGSITLILSLVIFSLVTELIELSYHLPKYQENIEIFISETIINIKYFYYVKLSPDILTTMQENIGTVTQGIQSFIISAIDSFLGFVSVIPQSIAGAATILVISLLATFFISKDKDLLVGLWLKIMPRGVAYRILTIAKEMVQAFFRYLKAQMILISITMLQAIIGLYIIGAEYALTMGLLVGFFDLIPIIGPSVIFVPWIIWSFIVGSTAFGIKLTLLYFTIVVVRQILETKVVADSLGLHPLATLISLYVGLKLFGFIGMIIGPLTLIALQAAYKSGVVTTFYIKK